MYVATYVYAYLYACILTKQNKSSIVKVTSSNSGMQVKIMRFVAVEENAEEGSYLL